MRRHTRQSVVHALLIVLLALCGRAAQAGDSTYQRLRIGLNSSETISYVEVMLGDYVALRAFGLNAETLIWEEVYARWSITPGLLDSGVYAPDSALAWRFKPDYAGSGDITISLPDDSTAQPYTIGCQVFHDDPSASASIQGFVYNSSATPLENARIMLLEPMTMQVTDSVYSGNNGSFYFPDIPADAPHYLLFDQHSYWGLPPQYWCPETTSVAPVFTFSVPPGQTMSIHAALSQAPPDSACLKSTHGVAALEGVLYDPSGAPVDSAVVEIIVPGDFTTVASAAADRNGAFRVVDIPGDLAHYVRIVAPPDATFPTQYWSKDGMTDFPEYHLSIPSGTTRYLGSVQTSHTPRSKTDSTSGEQRADVQVKLLQPDGSPYYGEAVIELMGRDMGLIYHRYRPSSSGETAALFYAVEPDVYAIRAAAKGFPFQFHEPTRNTDYPVYTVATGHSGDQSVSLRLTRTPIGAHRISGWVNDEYGNPLSRCAVRLYGPDASSTPRAVATVRTDGWFHFDQLPESEYFLQFIDSSGVFPTQWLGRDGTTRYPRYPIFSAGPSEDMHVQLSPTPLGTIPTCQLIVQVETDTGLDVSALSSVHLNLAEGGFLRGVRTSTSPALYAFNNLHPGDYAVQVRDLAYPEQYFHPDYSQNVTQPAHFVHLADADTAKVFMRLSHDPQWVDQTSPAPPSSVERIVAYLIDPQREAQFDSDGPSPFWQEYAESHEALWLWPEGSGRIVEGEGFSADHDAAVTARAAYGERGVYLLLQVVDNSLHPASQPTIDWAQDGFNCYWEARSPKELYDSPESSFYLYPDYQLTKSMIHIQAGAGAASDAAPMSVNRYDPGATNNWMIGQSSLSLSRAADTPGIVIKPLHYDDSSAVQEWLIPWRLVSTAQTAYSAQGMTMSFALEYHDEDLPGDRGALSWPHQTNPYGSFSNDAMNADGAPGWGAIHFGPELWHIADTSYPSHDDAIVTGRVQTETGSPIPNARVLLLPEQEVFADDCGWHNHLWSPWESATDSAGSFICRHVPEGVYYVYAEAPGSGYMARLYPSSENLSAARKIAVTAGDTIGGIDCSLPRGAMVIGFVKSSAGRKLSDIRVSLYEDVGCRWYETVTSETGKFVLGGVPEGTWHIECMDNRERYFLADTLRPDAITVSAGQEKLLDDILMSPGGRIRGTVSGQDTPASARDFARIYAYPASVSSHQDIIWPEHVMHVWADTMGFISNICPAGQWRFLFSPLATGERYEYEQPPSSSLKQDVAAVFAGAAQTFETAQSFAIEPAAQTDVGTVAFPSGYSVFGTCADQQGVPVNSDSTYGEYIWYSVKAFLRENGHYYLVSESHELRGGAFELPGLSPDLEYYLAVEAHDYPFQWWSPDSGNTYQPASSWSFAANADPRLHIPLSYQPSGKRPSHDDKDAPDAIYNVHIRPAGLHTFVVSWPRSPANSGISSYYVYRLPNVSSSDFVARENHWEPYDDESLMQRVDSFSVSDTFFVDHQATPGIPYMYVVAAVDTAGRLGRIDLPADTPIEAYTATIDHESFRSSVTVTANQWHMVGMPGIDTLVFAPDSQRFVYRWNQRIEADKLYGKYQRVSKAAPGEGVWVHSTSAFDLRFSESSYARLAANYQTVTARLLGGDDGWNQISSPFPYPVRPPWLGAKFTLWEWNPLTGYREATVMRPWQAYWVRNASRADTVVSISSLPALSPKAPLFKSVSTDGWELRLAASNSHGRDADNRIGVSARLAKALNAHAWEPPRAFEFPRLYLARRGEQLSRDFRAAAAIPDRAIQWHVAVAPSAEPAMIQVTGIESVPKQVHLFWVDRRGFHDMRAETAITVPSGDSTRYGYIIATTNPADIAVYTGALALRTNYPNPFMRSTSIEFVIPYAWGGDGISGEYRAASLDIFNARGQKVRTLLSGPVAVGAHRMVWDGTGHGNRRCSSGMYIARLVCGKSSKIIRMFKMH